MPYKPRVDNEAGAIYAKGIKGAAAYEAAGIREGAAGLASGIKVAGSELAGGIKDAGAIWREQAAQKKAEADLWSALNTKIDTMGHYGYITGRDADALAGIKKPTDLAAALTVIEQDIGRRQQAQQQEAQQNAMFQRWYTQKALERQQEMLDRKNSAQPGDTKVIVDPVTGKKTSFVFQNSAQIIPLNEQKSDKPKLTGVKKVEVGPGQFIYTDQEGNTINPKHIVDSGASDNTNIESLKEEQARLAGEAAKGKGKKSASWWPWGESVDDKLKGVTTQIDTLQGGAQPSASAQPSAAATPYKTKEAVQAAYRSGQLSREEAIKILTTQFSFE